MTTPLTEFVEIYIAAANSERPIGRELSPKTRNCYLEVVQAYEKHLGRAATIADLSPELINEFLVALLKSGRSSYTVKNRHTHLRALLRFAKREGLIDADPTRLRRVHCDPLDIKGYDEADMHKLLDAAATLKGIQRRTGVKRATYFKSLVLVMWNIGCRIGDIPLIRVDKFEPSGRLWVLEQKTRKPRWHLLQATTRDAVAECIAENPDREFIWKGYRIRNLYDGFSDLVKLAGVGGTSRFIRRGAASELERLQPNMGWRFLNHSTPSVFEKHYRCVDICEDESLAPPELKHQAAIGGVV